MPSGGYWLPLPAAGDTGGFVPRASLVPNSSSSEAAPPSRPPPRRMASLSSACPIPDCSGVLDGIQGSRVGTLSLLLHGWLTEAGVVTSLAISFLVRQRGRAWGGPLGAMACSRSLPRHGELNPSRGYLGSAGSDLSNRSPWACSSHGPPALRAVPMGILPPEKRTVCPEASKILTAAFPTGFWLWRQTGKTCHYPRESWLREGLAKKLDLPVMVSGFWFLFLY